MEMRDSIDLKVKSTAIVKYSVPKPAQFIKLQCNTDLNLPPSNWLSSSADSYGLQHALFHQKGFSSFGMAQMFPDCVGEVDVVSDAENIKKLLKIPYHTGHISMMVHRIENTLLLDDFDIYKHLLRTAESEWEWLRKFFVEHINHETREEDKNVYFKNRTREALKQKSLVSKFLYHSLGQSDYKTTDVGVQNKHTLPDKKLPLPEPSPSSEAPDSTNFGHKYNRNVVWTFEDIEMLLGTDMPIFGGGTYPCISLRLRDMNKPINVLTGIDYWLDNLMSNVPEVVMCYHLNGIVQRYELIKTEDLPRLDNSKFSPKVIRDVAQSILSFLKSNATKAGHTYWLFKGKDEEVVKLYDLTSLCSKKDVENGQNPFTIPVAMLLYRVARNMINSSERCHPGTIRMLLKNCIKLLPNEKYPEIVTSSHFMLSELYIPSDTNPETPCFDVLLEGSDTEVVYDDDLPENEISEPAIKFLDIMNNTDERFDNVYKPPPPIAGSVEDRCLLAIQHITAGLSCLKYFPAQTSILEEDDVPMAKPSEPIPMPYSKLCSVDTTGNKKSSQKQKERNRKKHEKNINQKESFEMNNALLPKNKNETQPLPTWQDKNSNPSISWKDHLKTLLYEKALLVFATLSENHFISGNYGSSIRNIALLARCQHVMNKLLYTSNALRENCLLGRAGDCCVMIVQNWNNVDSFREQLQNNIDEDLRMMEQLENDERFYNITVSDSNMSCVFIHDIRSIEQMLLKAVECYEDSLKSSPTDSILRRLGNSLNEVASFYLNAAKNSKTEEEIIDSANKAEPYLVRGLEVFEKAKDDANVALLYTNTGHLYRLLAYACTPTERGELTHREKTYYNKSFLYYKKALNALGGSTYNCGIWETVKWELSTALFNMGTIMHEHPPSSLTKAEAEKDVIEILQKALQYCDLDDRNAKLPLYQYRAAMIHYRIASLYHNHILTTSHDSLNRKNIIQLSKINYEKASKLFYVTNDVVNYFTSQMQRFALLEYLTETTNMPNLKMKHLHSCLILVLEVNDMVELLVQKKIDMPEENVLNNSVDDNKTFKTSYSLLNLIKQRLQYILKNLVKLSSSKSPQNGGCSKTEIYKNCYKLSFELEDGLEYYDLLCKLNSVLTKMKTLVLKV